MVPELTDGLTGLLAADVRQWLERDILPHYVKQRRWYASKDKSIQAVRIASFCLVPFDGGDIAFCEIEVDLEASQETYQLHLGLWSTDDGENHLGNQLKLADVTWRGRPAYITDAFALDTFAFGCLKIIEERRTDQCQVGKIIGVRQRDVDFSDRFLKQPPRRISAEQSNSSLIAGDTMIMKLIRRVMPGINPEVEMVRFLTEQGYANTPPLLGEMQRHANGGDPYSMIVLQKFIPNQGDGWEFTLRYLQANPLDFQEYSLFSAAIGKRLGELHAVLSSAVDNPAFAAREAGESDVQAWVDGANTQIMKAVSVLRDRQDRFQHGELDRIFVLQSVEGLMAALPRLAGMVISTWARFWWRMATRILSTSRANRQSHLRLAGQNHHRCVTLPGCFGRLTMQQPLHLA